MSRFVHLLAGAAIALCATAWLVDSHTGAIMAVAGACCMGLARLIHWMDE